MSWFKQPHSTQVGRFEIDAELIDDNPDVIRAVMATCIPIKAEMVPHSGKVLYLAICQAFDGLADGQEPPTYDVGYDSDTGVVSWTKAGG